MDYGMGPELEAFRHEVRDFVTAHAPVVTARAGVRSPENETERDAMQEWTARLYEAGYAGTDWPVEFGGRPPSAQASSPISTHM